MHAPDGAAFDNVSEFREVAPPERLVFQHPRARPRISDDDAVPVARGTEKPSSTWRMLFDDVSECTRVKRFIIAANEQNFDRLAAHLIATH